MTVPEARSTRTTASPGSASAKASTSRQNRKVTPSTSTASPLARGDPAGTSMPTPRPEPDTAGALGSTNDWPGRPLPTPRIAASTRVTSDADTSTLRCPAGRIASAVVVNTGRVAAGAFGCGLTWVPRGMASSGPSVEIRLNSSVTSAALGGRSAVPSRLR
jgi:hypothetical protein